ncbi:unnamed protein product, partial [marine sediment metagenome]
LVHAGTREVFDNCLSFGVAPGFTRGARALYREFMPLIVSLLEAGWQPVPQARYSVEDAVVERFGSFEADTLTFTVRQTSHESADGTLTVLAREAGIPDRQIVVMDMRLNRPIECKWDGSRLIVPLPTQAGRTEVVRVSTQEGWERECMSQLAKALDRAGREWAWVKAQHDNTLTGTLQFEDDAGRWFRYGFEGAKVGLSDEAHSGAHALNINARKPIDGRIRTDPFVVRKDTVDRLAFEYRAEGTGEVKATAVF